MGSQRDAEKIRGTFPQEYEYNEAMKAFFKINMNSKTLDIQKPNPMR
jgi:hypothetical protein